MTVVAAQTLGLEVKRALAFPVCVRLVSAVLFAILASALTALTPVALKSVIDRLAAGAVAASVVMAALLYVAVLAASRVSATIQAYLFATGSQSFQSRVSSRIFDRLLRLPLQQHIAIGSGSLSQTHNHALQGVRTVTSIICFTLLPATVQMTVILAVVGSLSNFSVWLVLACAIAAYIGIFALGVHRIAAPSRRALERQVDAGQWFSDALVNAEAVKALGVEEQVRTRFDEHTTHAEQCWRTCYVRRTETGLLATCIFLATIFSLTCLAGAAIAAGEMSIGDFVLLHAYALQIVAPLEATGAALRDLTEGMSYLEGWRRLLRLPVEALDGPEERQSVATPETSIEFSDVTFAYEPGRPVLVGVTFSAPPKGIVAIVGASGAGKSSILKLLQGHYPPDSGRILVNGAPIETTNLHRLRRSMGVVSQDPALFNDTLRFNLLLANPRCTDALLQEALCASRLQPLVASLPDGLDTLVGDRGLRLSGGERQRLAIARALLRAPDILLLDEPTSALDPETEHEISIDLLNASAARSILVVTHRLALASDAHWIIALRDGRVVEQGNHQMLIKAGGYYAQLWRQQSVHGCDQQAMRPTGIAENASR